MILLLVNSWLLTMTTVAYVLRSPIHSPQVAAPMNLERDAGTMIVALVQCTTLVVQ
jgi:hypothetical protein